MSQCGVTGSGLSIEQRLTYRGVMHIVDSVVKRCGVPRELILGRYRGRSISNARKEVYRSLRALGLSYPEIGYLVDRDHSTIMAACRGGTNGLHP